MCTFSFYRHCTLITIQCNTIWCLCCVSHHLFHSLVITSTVLSNFNVENDSVNTRTLIIDIPHAMLLSLILNSLCSGACQLEMKSTPNDDVYSGSF